MLEPRLRQVTKTSPLYPLNSFPASFPRKLAEHICVHLATRGNADLEGKDWEKIFADCIGANWTPSNIGLDDITHKESSTAWGAKTVKGKILSRNSRSVPQKVRLISGRNSTNFSFNETANPKSSDPNEIGEMILEIWNRRVREVRAKFSNLRTAVLIKGKDLSSVIVFEYDTDLYINSDFTWIWNKNSNLEGRDLNLNHKFTWQPHGSQFTIIETVPENSLKIRIKKPEVLNKEFVLEQIGFNDSFFSSF